MQRIKLALWGLLGALTFLWLLQEPSVFQPAGFFPLRSAMAQYSGVLAIGCMSAGLILALRPRWPEKWFGGLDKMYRLHKWLGIAALVIGVIHYLWAKGPKWAVGLGLLEKPHRGPRAIPENAIEQTFSSMRPLAESVGEWASYAAAALIIIALVKYVPYRWFFKTHRLLAIAYLALVFHSVPLTTFGYWSSPLGVVLAILIGSGSVAAVAALVGGVGAGRAVQGTIAALQYYPGVRALEVQVAVPQGWPGHQAGQFAFATSDASEGHHPYTITSAWNDSDRRINFIVKEAGDHTQRLREKLSVGQDVTIEGPYGCFTFDDGRPRQIWVAGGIGITPFVARMKYLAAAKDRPRQTIDLFHPTRDYDGEAISKLEADAKAAGVRLHVLVGSRDGRLNGERIRQAVPEWSEASIWFCGPAGFGEALRQDFAEHGLPVKQRFHQELFAMR